MSEIKQKQLYEAGYCDAIKVVIKECFRLNYPLLGQEFDGQLKKYQRERKKANVQSTTTNNKH